MKENLINLLKKVSKSLLQIILIQLLLYTVVIADNVNIRTSFQESTITGRVTSMSNDEGLPGVNVVEKGTRNGTVTDMNGQYSLTVSNNATIVFSSVGFTTEEIKVGGRSVIDLSMAEDVQQLQELVVVGYGTQEKSDLTGSVVRADIDAFREKHQM